MFKSVLIFNQQRNLKEEIVATLKSCKKSLFILEEFDDDNEIVQKLTETLKPFMDYTSEEADEVDSRQAIFLILRYMLLLCRPYRNIKVDSHWLSHSS